ncbi:uncharacterized protein LOC111708026 isoform X2 [Eurytemora carolleeae]|uniref:uncharacterized protein LOC111708026 isoform X2 n=1 Tax=Eurytemora carolleeae TaxID=1294199 RepID=UPI000C782AEF|nr:uncharacterized protein LOC111708026 isoform X2 [Eurytemora carolleeae]|eukprot:XP_023337032.1 uncharacterized protein LOC111708026 isoform X2 [Eurytemora affinis]
MDNFTHLNISLDKLAGDFEEKNRQLYVILSIIISVFAACFVVLVAYMVIYPSYTDTDRNGGTEIKISSATDNSGEAMMRAIRLLSILHQPKFQIVESGGSVLHHNQADPFLLQHPHQPLHQTIHQPPHQPLPSPIDPLQPRYLIKPEESSFSSQSPSNPVVVEESLDAHNNIKRDTPTTTPDLEDPINSSSELEKDRSGTTAWADHVTLFDRMFDDETISLADTFVHEMDLFPPKLSRGDDDVLELFDL